MTEQYAIPAPPKDIFLYDMEAKTDDIINEGATTYMLEKVEIGDGIKLYYQGAKYPAKGFPFPEAIWSINILKRLLIVSSKLPLWVLVFQKKKREYMTGQFIELGYKIMKKYLLKMCYMTPLARELQISIKVFLVRLGFNNQTSYDLSVLLSHLIEYDNAYRFLIGDLLTESSKSKMMNKPIREILRLLKIFKVREVEKGTLSKRFQPVALLVCFALLIPKVRLAWRTMLSLCRFEDLQFDEADRYWVLNRTDYNYLGETFESRFSRMNPAPQGYKVKMS